VPRVEDTANVATLIDRVPIFRSPSARCAFAGVGQDQGVVRQRCLFDIVSSARLASALLCAAQLSATSRPMSWLEWVALILKGFGISAALLLWWAVIVVVVFRVSGP
jgi:hypothetical protein